MKQKRFPYKKRIKKNVQEPIAEEVTKVLENTEPTYKQRLFYIYYVKSFNETSHYSKTRL